MISPRNMGTSPTRRYDEDADVLYIELDSPMTGGQAEFDNEEIFIFRDGESDEVIGFAIHSYKVYWEQRIDQLTSHLASYNRARRVAIATLLASGQRSVPQLQGSQFQLIRNPRLAAVSTAVITAV